jgi:hypothetical protein
MIAEYERIFARTTQDPGTAGDDGEENWATVLRRWLPAGFTVVTKGRILFTDKTASPQVDVVVLRSGYPDRLLTKKLYLSSGVLAAFECKNTLKLEHIGKAAATAALLKAKSNTRQIGITARRTSCASLLRPTSTQPRVERRGLDPARQHRLGG